MKPSIVYLVGFMGSGKSSVGRHLAGLLDWAFVDLDVEIERTSGAAVREIFRRAGEAAFREMESGELEKMRGRKNAVIALGGGAFCREDNRKIIRESGVSVWLDVPLGLSLDRCEADAARPLAADREGLRRLWESRQRHYAEADFRIDAGEGSVDDLARRIIDKLSAHAGRLAERPQE